MKIKILKHHLTQINQQANAAGWKVLGARDGWDKGVYVKMMTQNGDVYPAAWSAWQHEFGCFKRITKKNRKKLKLVMDEYLEDYIDQGINWTMGLNGIQHDNKDVIAGGYEIKITINKMTNESILLKKILGEVPMQSDVTHIIEKYTC